MTGIVRRFWLFVVLVHFLGAIGWVWLMPGGFPHLHARTISNRLLPLLLIAWSLQTLRAGWKKRPAAVSALLLSAPVGWLACAVVSGIVFPTSAALIWLVVVAIALAAALTLRKSVILWPTFFINVIFMAFIGAALPICLRAPSAGTLPNSRTVLHEIPHLSDPTPVARSVALNSGVRVQTGSGEVWLNAGKLTVYVEPMLTFSSVSPDGSWVIFARKGDRVPPLRRLTGWEKRESAIVSQFEGGDWLRVVSDSETEATILAVSTLRKPVYSHLNVFTTLMITGHDQLRVAFSPMPEHRIEVTPADYPTGRARKAAYLDAQGVFHVVEARSGEKGPFRELAQGVLDPAAPLTMTFYDHDRPIAEVTLEDFAGQADVRTLSPSAGWGLPTNAIEFALEGDKASSAAGIYITLAGTSLGRGWDTVGHRAGTYLNHMRVRLIPP